MWAEYYPTPPLKNTVLKLSMQRVKQIKSAVPLHHLHSYNFSCDQLLWWVFAVLDLQVNPFHLSSPKQQTVTACFSGVGPRGGRPARIDTNDGRRVTQACPSRCKTTLIRIIYDSEVRTITGEGDKTRFFDFAPKARR